MHIDAIEGILGKVVLWLYYFNWVQCVGLGGI